MATTVAAIERVYRGEGGRMQAALRRRCGSEQMAQDVISEAFAQAIRRADYIDNPAAWIWTAAYRLAGGQLAKEANLQPIEAAPEPQCEPDSFADYHAVLRALPRMQRAAVTLVDCLGLSHRDAAALVGSTERALRVHAFRARRTLQPQLV